MMKKKLFDLPFYQYELNDWQFKKRGLVNRIDRNNFIRSDVQFFESDREVDRRGYIKYLDDLISPELNKFCQEEKVSCKMTDAWCVRYRKGDYQNIHNHRSIGYFGILYFEFDPNIHESTLFLCPWQDPKTDKTLYTGINVKEGTLLIAPAFLHHFVKPSQSKKQRIIISFDLLPIK